MNTAECNCLPDHGLPVEIDHRGGDLRARAFWACWELTSRNMGAETPGVNVIELADRMLVGELGFLLSKSPLVVALARASRGLDVALCLGP